MQEAPRFLHENLETSKFRWYWVQGIPIVVSGVKLQGTYDPAHFIDHYGHLYVTIENCETGEKKRTTVALFFEDFGKPAGERNWPGSWKLKVCLPHLPPAYIM
jgi:hypothetical protein